MFLTWGNIMELIQLRTTADIMKLIQLRTTADRQLYRQLNKPNIMKKLKKMGMMEGTLDQFDNFLIIRYKMEVPSNTFRDALEYAIWRLRILCKDHEDLDRDIQDLLTWSKRVISTGGLLIRALVHPAYAISPTATTAVSTTSMALTATTDASTTSMAPTATTDASAAHAKRPRPAAASTAPAKRARRRNTLASSLNFQGFWRARSTRRTMGGLASESLYQEK